MKKYYKNGKLVNKPTSLFHKGINYIPPTDEILIDAGYIIKEDELFMKLALEEAELALETGDIPVGAVITCNGEVIARGRNRREADKNAVAHAEVIAIEEACKKIGGWRLSDCTLYVTLEPCPMCAGAIVNARISRVVYGASDSVSGCVGSVLNFNAYPFNHTFSVTQGVLEEESVQMLRSFFEKKRNKVNKRL